MAAIPPTKMRLGMTVPYFGAWVPPRGVDDGVADGETSADEDCKQIHHNATLAMRNQVLPTMT